MLNSAYAHHDRITLSGITAVGFHGVLDFEKRDGQPFTVDATLYTDFADAAAGDDLEKTTNYAQVAELIHQKIVFGIGGFDRGFGLFVGHVGPDRKSVV